MASMQMHNSFGGNGPPTNSNSNSAAVNLSVPNGLPSGLSVTITPAAAGAAAVASSSPTATSSSSRSITITKSGGGNSQILNKFLIPERMETSSISPPLQPVQNDRQQQQQQFQNNFKQQQQLRALATTLQSMTTNLNSMNISPASVLNQASLVAAASKLMEGNSAAAAAGGGVTGQGSSSSLAGPPTPSADELVMQEVTQRLFKMNQDLWQQAALAGSANIAAAASIPQQQSPGQQGQVQGQLNEMKMAENFVKELAVQQSTRNAFRLNERTLQECWNTLQRVSCMIFMHKSAMQLQQQQQVAGGTPQHGLMRTGSVSSGGSESGALSKPHQCHQCLKSFSSNHQLVQHIRVHTGEKPYKCSYCDRRFKQLSHVQQHTRLHTGERPYKCHVHDCGRAFIQLSNLQQHLRNHDAQLERSKNRPFHCNICGKGFATESSLRTHTAKVCKDQHAALIGGPNAVTCPICHKLFLGGEALMEHMKHTHKDPNASGVATKRRTANHPCPICGKHYVNEGSLRKHLTCHPETAQLSSSLRMWPCSVCQAVYTHEAGLLTHMDQMRMDPKHQFAAQYVLSRAAAERRERENILTAAAVAAMTGNHSFGSSVQGQQMPPMSLMPMMPPSPSGSESSGRLSSPLESNSGISSVSVLQQNRMSSPHNNGPLDARINPGGNSNNNNTGPMHRSAPHLSNMVPGNSPNPNPRKEFVPPPEKYENYDKHAQPHHNHHMENNLALRDHHHHQIHIENGLLPGKFQMSEQAAMKMAAILGQSQGHGHGHGHGHGGPSQNDLRNFIQQQANASQMNGQDVHMSSIQAEALLRSEALRIAVQNSNSDRGNGSHNPNIQNGMGGGSDNNMSGMTHHEIHQRNLEQNGLGGNPMHGHTSASLNHQLNSILNQQDLSEALLRQFDPRNIGFSVPALNS